MLTLAMCATLANADTGTTGVIPRSSAEAPNDAVGFRLAPGLRATANVGLVGAYNSNFFLQESNPQSSFGFVLTPSVLFLKETKKLKYQFGVGLEAARYTNVDVGPNSYLDGSVKGRFDWDAETRHHFSGDYYSNYSHDPFGSFRTENGFNVSDALDKWLETGGRFRYRFGASGALINLESEGGLVGRRYQTNRSQTETLDFRSLSARETAYVNVSSKTALIAEYVHTNFGYYTGALSRDSQENHYRAGVHWLATNTTSGDIRVGRFHRTFDNSQISDQSGTDWTASLTWAPLVYSVFTLQSGMQTSQSYLAGVALIANRFELVDWTHDWTYSLRTRAVYSHVNSEFLGSGRLDKIDTFGFETNYLSSQRWMWLADASYSRRNSTNASRDYNNTSIYLGLRYSR
jgi:polysaccharide biosynthesis protein VpsM